MRSAGRRARALEQQHHLQEMREQLAELYREQEWQRRLGVIAALLPYSGPLGRGWSNLRPAARIPQQRAWLTAGEKRVARAAEAAARRALIPQQRRPLEIESRRGEPIRGASPEVAVRPRIERIRQSDGRFGTREDVQNNRNPRGFT